jgi:LmbE family N-acetylglucosaminyl deacetylase
VLLSTLMLQRSWNGSSHFGRLLPALRVGERVCEHHSMTATIVSFHAHPDDEAITVGGTLALAADAGHRVVLVFATRGDLGEVTDGALAPDEQLAERREQEARAAADVLGVARVEFLPYHDSGMAGEPTNDGPDAFAAADVEEAAAHLAALLREEHADVLTVYDERGGYGHPDHVQVHLVGRRAAALAGTPRVYAATVSAEHFRALPELLRGLVPDDLDTPTADEIDLGVAEARITTVVDVTDVLDRKQAAMAAHPSQIADDSYFLALPPAAFAIVFGTEWFIRLDETPAEPETWIL